MKYVAEISNVREVTLMGTSEFAPWEAELRHIGLTPLRRDDRAEMFVSVAAASWKGKRFREVAVGVSVSRRPEGDSLDGYYMACAFHSSRLFAWIERTCFKAPHRAADVTLNDQLPARFEIRCGGHCGIRASMGAAREPIREGDEPWELPIYVPNRDGGDAAKRSYYYARASGPARIYAFDTANDVIVFNEGASDPVVAKLAECRFVGSEWLIRGSGVHARGKTMSESKVITIDDQACPMPFEGAKSPSGSEAG